MALVRVYRRLLRQRGIAHRIARRGAANVSGSGRMRWVVERTFARLHAVKRLATCYERRADLHEGLLAPGALLFSLSATAMNRTPPAIVRPAHQRPSAPG
jgi:transposase